MLSRKLNFKIFTFIKYTHNQNVIKHSDGYKNINSFYETNIEHTKINNKIKNHHDDVNKN